MKFNRYTKQEFIDAVNNSISARQVIIKLGLNEAGGNYSTIKNGIKELNLNTDHFLGRGWNLGKESKNKIPLSEILVNQSTYKSNNLKLRLFSKGIKQRKCEICGLSKWLEKDISLELDHINGNRFDHRLENLRILCPNCHSTTETYRNKKRN